MESEIETRIRYSCLLAREICATWGREASLRSQDEGDTPVNLPPSLILNAISIIRQATMRCDGKIRCSDMAEACIFIASKITECRLRLDDVCMSGRFVEARRRGEITETIVQRKRAVLGAEMEILAMCGFVVKQNDETRPHRYLLALCEMIVQKDAHSRILESAWAYLNDAVMLDIENVRPFDVACAALALAAQDESVALPSGPIPWYEAVGANKESMEAIAFQIYDLINVWQPPIWIE